MHDWAMCLGCKNLVAANSVCSHCGFDNAGRVTQAPPAPAPTRKLSPDQLAGRACVYCGAQDQDMRPNEAWGEASAGLFECIDAAACEMRYEELVEAALEAKWRAEEDTANTLWEQGRREAEEEEERPLRLEVFLDNEELSMCANPRYTATPLRGQQRQATSDDLLVDQ